MELTLETTTIDQDRLVTKIYDYLKDSNQDKLASDFLAMIVHFDTKIVNKDILLDKTLRELSIAKETLANDVDDLK